MIRVLVVDDHAMVRSGLEQLLSTADDIELVGTAADGEAALRLVAELAPDLVLMDLAMPVLDGVEATRRIAAEHPATQVVALTSFSDRQRILDVVRAGAAGYVLKHAGPDELLGAIRTAHAGGAPLDPKAARVLLDDQRAGAVGPRLSERELEVLRLVVEGLANKNIGRRLGITERTVKAHLTSVFQRLGVTDRTQAALWAKDHLPDLDAG
ncbi:MAG: two component transcriptional regulator, LuxR family [Acidimicrobiales bacterium]|nr:two component transcriptional regulator, LuxR family [Acidimicrobiales bacterium]